MNPHQPPSRRDAAAPPTTEAPGKRHTLETAVARAELRGRIDTGRWLSRGGATAMVFAGYRVFSDVRLWSRLHGELNFFPGAWTRFWWAVAAVGLVVYQVGYVKYARARRDAASSLDTMDVAMEREPDPYHERD